MPYAARIGDPVGHGFDFGGLGATIGALVGAAVAACVTAPIAAGAVGLLGVVGGPLVGALVHTGASALAGLAVVKAVKLGAWGGAKLGRRLVTWLADALHLHLVVSTGAILKGDFTVLIESSPAARACIDFAACSYHPSQIPPAIVEGSDFVRIGGHPAARVGDAGACEFHILRGARHVIIGGAPHLCDCARQWKELQDEAMAIIAPYDGDHRERNRVISAAYAKLYMSNPHDFIWAGLAAYASKQVGCAMDHARGAVNTGRGMTVGGAGAVAHGLARGPAGIGEAVAGGVVGAYGAGAAGAADYTYELLGKGNRELFLDIYPLQRFYQLYGMEALKSCAGARNPPIPLVVLDGFEALTGEHPDRQKNLRLLAEHEQLNILQEQIYNDELFRDILVANETGLPMTSPAKVIMSSGCSDPTSDGSMTLKFNDGWFSGNGVPELYDQSERMDWILGEVATDYEKFEGKKRHTDDLEEIIRQGEQARRHP